MLLRFALSGSTVFEGRSDCVPPPGAQVIFTMQTYKKGMSRGTVVQAVVGDDIPPTYEFGTDGAVEVTLDVEHFVIINDTNAEPVE